MHSNTEYILAKTKEIELLAETTKNKVFLVKDDVTGALLIKKQLPIETNIEVYKKLTEKNISGLPKIHYVVSDNHHNYVFEDYVSGKSFLKMQNEKKTFEPKQVTEWFIRLCDILAILHESNPPIIHRDIKPSNIIISNDGILKLIDFDIAREYKMDSDADTAHIGTKKYASPEQYGFSQTDCRSDIFSAGMMMAELLTGEVSEENLNAHGELGKIISKCIEVDPKQRFQNVKEVRKALANKPSNKSRKIIGFIAAGIIAACVVIAMLFAISRPNNETQNLNGGMQNLNSETQTGGEVSDFIEAPDFLAPTQGTADELSNELPDFNSVGLELESFYNIVIQHPTINRELREILGDMYDFFMENMTRSMVRNNAIGGVFPDELDGKRVLHMFSTPQNPSVVFSSVIVSENGNIYVWLTIDKRHYHFTNDANRIYRIPYEFPAYSQIFLGENVFANASGNTNLQQGENIFYKGYNTITITLDGNEAHFELVTISPWVDETAVFSGEFTLDSNYVFFTNYRHRVPAERITAHFNFIEGYLYFGGFAQLFNRRNFEPLDGIYRLR